ncbi:hypothetical protein LQV63_02880 [Paenibacillus profundus]|uniref:Uncharacterized protein n=1 Tax=Paenibacillus profundus TaxID=1173085 RepID=A0ABS8Y8Z7_9BACL|nr:hypothetical protein [Paenibacillus profundus]MCE5168260.1 hypothetical protein [Paenibacillus profundus]
MRTRKRETAAFESTPIDWPAYFVEKPANAAFFSAEGTFGTLHEDE